tara:strand:- start:1489 stop:1872 length:384 start_codon:yes stop_codon:yes gene_type:complete
MPTTDQAVAGYIQLRDMKKAMQAKHSEEMAPIKERMDKIEAWFLRELQVKQKAESVRTESGTVYLTRVTKPKVQDGAVFLDFLKANDLLHMLELRPSTSAVEEFIEANNAPPPGISVTREINARVRK